MLSRQTLQVNKTDINLKGHDMFHPAFAHEPTIEVSSITSENYTSYESRDLPYECNTCGDMVGPYLVKTSTGFEINHEECAYPNGVPAFTALLNFHSGRIAFADDLRFAVGDIGGKRIVPSYNSALGRRLVMADYAAKNIAYGFVSNTSPSVFVDTNNDDIHIASQGYDEEDNPLPLPSTWEPVGSICTDLWAFTMMDATEFEATGAEVKDYGWIKSPQFAHINPGTYEYTHYADQPGFDFYAPETLIYATLRRKND